MTNDWASIREKFSLDSSMVHLGAFWLSSYPSPVREAIDYYRSHLDWNPVFYLLDNEERLDRAARAAIGRYINGDPDNVVLTGSTTEGLSLSLAGWRLSAGDEVLTTEHEHYSAYSSADMLVRRAGVRVKRISLYKVGSVSQDSMIDSILKAITSDTRLILLTWIHSGTGVRIPIEEICQRVQQINVGRMSKERICVCIDGTHGFGAMRLDVEMVGCDLFVSSCHKWLNGPRGTGFVYGSLEGMRRMQPIVPSFAPSAIGRFMNVQPRRDEEAWEALTPGGFHAYEHRWAISDAIEFAESIGQLAIEARILELAYELKTLLMQIPCVEVITPTDGRISAGIICFNINGMTPEETFKELRKRNIVASVSPYRIRYARFTPSYFNTKDELNRAAEAILDIGRTKR